MARWRTASVCQACFRSFRRRSPSTKDVVDYLLNAGFEVPLHANPLDFFMDLVTPERQDARVDTFVLQYRC